MNIQKKTATFFSSLCESKCVFVFGSQNKICKFIDCTFTFYLYPSGKTKKTKRMLVKFFFFCGAAIFCK